MNASDETARTVVWILAGAITPAIAHQIGGGIAALAAMAFVLALVCIVYLRNPPNLDTPNTTPQQHKPAQAPTAPLQGDTTGHYAQERYEAATWQTKGLEDG